MGRAKQLIIAEQEKSSMVSTWTEYLVLERRAKTKDWRLFVGRYEALAEAAAYYCEAADSYRIPKTIDGKKVVGQDDEWLVGGPLQCWGDLECTFSQVDAKLFAWLREFGWTGEGVLSELDRALSKLGAAWTHLKSFELEGEYFHLWLDTGESRPFVVLRKAFHELKTNPVIFKVSATNSRRFLNAVRSAWYLMWKRDAQIGEVQTLAHRTAHSSPSLSRAVVGMFNRMLLERVEGEGQIIQVSDPDSSLPKLLFVAKHVLVAEGQQQDTSFLRPPPLFRVSYRHDGRSIGGLCWVEGGRFSGSGSYGPHDLPFSAATLQELAYEALKTEEWILSTS